MSLLSATARKSRLFNTVFFASAVLMVLGGGLVVIEAVVRLLVGETVIPIWFFKPVALAGFAGGAGFAVCVVMVATRDAIAAAR